MKDGRFVLTESRAIANYLVSKYQNADLASLYPGIWGALSSQEKASVDEMLHYDIGTFYKRVGAWVYPQLFGGAEADEEKFAMIIKSLEYLDSKIKKNGGGLCTKHLTVADLSVALSLSMLDFFDLDLSAHKYVGTWLNAVKSLPQWEEVNEAFVQWVANVKDAQGSESVNSVKSLEEKESPNVPPLVSPKKSRRGRKFKK
jgi:glutathione S-transferase